MADSDRSAFAALIHYSPSHGVLRSAQCEDMRQRQTDGVKLSDDTHSVTCRRCLGLPRATFRECDCRGSVYCLACEFSPVVIS